MDDEAGEDGLDLGYTAARSVVHDLALGRRGFVLGLVAFKGGRENARLFAGDKGGGLGEVESEDARQEGEEEL